MRWIFRALLLVGLISWGITLAGFLLYARSPVCAVDVDNHAFVIDCSPDRYVWRANFAPDA